MTASNRKTRNIVMLLLLLGSLHLVVLGAGFIAPYDYAAQNRTLPFAPPTGIHFVDARGKWHLRPFVYRLADQPGAAGSYEFGSYIEDKSQEYPLHFLVRGDEYQLPGSLRSHVHLFGVDEPARIFLIGSDGYGRDQFSRLLFGGQISLFAGLLAASLTIGLGLAFGTLAGFYGKWTDEAIMRTAELFLALPWIYLLFAVRAFLPLHISPAAAFLLLVALIGSVGWARPARLVRGVVLSARERNYVLASRNFGASDFHLLRRHILPQTAGVILTQAALLIPQYILAEVTLSFLGLGIGEPVPSWGNMLASLQQYHVLASYWWMAIPGLALIPVSWCYFALANALQDR
jgi:peptide/nickel transport system permease protein